ncbi:MAG: hypothetical protein IIA92_14315 [Chloroflexi bacterium]|nr:hypothetical protein [Chloroflexota bacterium]
MNSVNSLLNSLRELITILTGLAIANAVLVFLTDGTLSSVPYDQISDPVRYIPFGLLLINLIRFYHGNMRILDEMMSKNGNEYGGSQRGTEYDAPGRAPWLVYFGIMLQHTVFVVAGIYQGTPAIFLPLLSSVLFIDLIMFVPGATVNLRELFRQGWTAMESRRWQKELGYEGRFVLNNLFIGLIVGLGIGEVVFYMGDQRDALFVFSGAFAFNTVLDYKFNWNLYFPREWYKVFLAAPQTLHQSERRERSREFQRNLQDFMDKLERTGARVFNSHERELWGTDTWEPKRLAWDDYQNMKASTVLVVGMDTIPSGGVNIELGWASMMRKPIFVAHARDETVSLRMSAITEKLKGMVDIATKPYHEKFSETIPDLRAYWNMIHKYNVLSSTPDLHRWRKEALEQPAKNNSGLWLLCQRGETFDSLVNDPDFANTCRVISSEEIQGSVVADFVAASGVVIIMEETAPLELIDAGWASACGIPLCVRFKQGIDVSPLLRGLGALYSGWFLDFAIDEFTDNNQLKRSLKDQFSLSRTDFAAGATSE